jgi:hypothetical protein
MKSHFAPNLSNSYSLFQYIAKFKNYVSKEFLQSDSDIVGCNENFKEQIKTVPNCVIKVYVNCNDET